MRSHRKIITPDSSAANRAWILRMDMDGHNQDQNRRSRDTLRFTQGGMLRCGSWTARPASTFFRFR